MKRCRSVSLYVSGYVRHLNCGNRIEMLSNSYIISDAIIAESTYNLIMLPDHVVLVSNFEFESVSVLVVKVAVDGATCHKTLRCQT